MNDQPQDSVRKGKHGEVYTTESGFTFAEARPGEIGWIVAQVKPTEHRIRVVWREHPKPDWYMASNCD